MCIFFATNLIASITVCFNVVIIFYAFHRCLDIEPLYRSKARFVTPLVIIPGPKEPSNITPYLQGTLQAFREFGPSGACGTLVHIICIKRRDFSGCCVGPASIMVNDRCRDANTNGIVVGRSFKHEPIMACFTADSPCRCKVAKWSSHAAFLGCGSCCQHGTNKTPDGSRCAMHFLGYAGQATGGLMVPGEQQVSGFCGSSVFWLDHEDHVRRATMVESGEWDKGQAGCHGMSPVIQHLPYALYDRVFTCSVAHALLLGLVKDFWSLLLCHVKKDEGIPWYSIPRETRKIMADRAGDISATMDQSRPYRCVVKQRGNWVMEDWLNWTEIWSVAILRPLHPVSLHCK